MTPGYLQMSVTNWGTYDPVKVGYAPTEAPTLTEPNPTDATKVYTSTTPRICTVSEAGVVKGVNSGDCTIRLTLSKDTYNDFSHDYNITVTMDLVRIQTGQALQGAVDCC